MTTTQPTPSEPHTRWPRARVTSRHTGFVSQTWRSGPLSIVRLRFDGADDDAVQSLHLGRVALARGGDGVAEGFVDGVKALWLKGTYPQIVVSWWPSEAELLSREVNELRARSKRLRKERDALGHDYGEAKTHLYGRIDTLRRRAERVEETLALLAEIHHRTKVGSDLHVPELRSWQDCDCLTCAAVFDVIGGTEAARAEAAAALQGADDAV